LWSLAAVVVETRPELTGVLAVVAALVVLELVLDYR
jgi:hypothetical protein